MAPGKVRVRTALIFGFGLSLLSSGAAAGAQRATLGASFSPERLGQPSTVFFGFRISSIPPTASSPLTNVSVLLPEEIGIATSGLGLANCLPLNLELRGPAGCPADARMGTGTATAEIPLGGDTVVESAQVELFSAPVQHGRLGLMVYVDASSPVFAQLVFPVTVIPASAPYGEGIDTEVPLIPSVPGAPDVAISSFRMALGSTGLHSNGFLYYRSVHGRRVPYTPDGLLLPPTCPRGGFPLEAQFEFQDHTSTTAHTTVPCPRRARRLRSESQTRS